MNILKPSVTGIDIPIQNLQTVLYNQVLALWPVTDANFKMFGRVYRNQTKDGYAPEAFVANTDYTETLFDDSLSASAFFGVGENTKVVKGDTDAEVYLIFMVNLALIKQGATRNDEEARIDIEQIMLERNYGFFLTNMITGIDNVFKEYGAYKKIKGLQFKDMHPWHCFRLNFKVNYNIYDTTNQINNIT